MTADLIEKHLEGVVPCFVYGWTLLQAGYRWTSEDEKIESGEFYAVTPFGIWRVE